MTKIYMVIGCPGSGKSWVCGQLREQFDCLLHDDYMAFPPRTYIEAIAQHAECALKPLLIEAPFSISQIKDPLEKMGFDIVPVFIQEHSDVVRKRYREREGKEIPAGHLSRQNTYAERAASWGSYSGTSAQVLNHLRNAVADRYPWEN